MLENMHWKEWLTDCMASSQMGQMSRHNLMVTTAVPLSHLLFTLNFITVTVLIRDLSFRSLDPLNILL